MSFSTETKPGNCSFKHFQQLKYQPCWHFKPITVQHMQNNQENFYLTANKLKINANKLLLLIVYYTEETMMDDCVLHFGIELVNCIPI